MNVASKNLGILKMYMVHVMCFCFKNWKVFEIVMVTFISLIPTRSNLYLIAQYESKFRLFPPPLVFYEQSRERFCTSHLPHKFNNLPGYILTDLIAWFICIFWGLLENATLLCKASADCFFSNGVWILSPLFSPHHLILSYILISTKQVNVNYSVVIIHFQITPDV